MHTKETSGGERDMFIDRLMRKEMTVEAQYYYGHINQKLYMIALFFSRQNEMEYNSSGDDDGSSKKESKE
jgi:hypothetical protein